MTIPTTIIPLKERPVKVTITQTPKSSTLMAASNQWRDRPADERFWTIAEMRERCVEIDKARMRSPASLADLETTYSEKDGLRLIGRDKELPCVFSNWGFSQLCTRIRAPAGYLRELPGEMVHRLVNHGLRSLEEQDKDVTISVRTDRKVPTVEAFVSDRYCYIPNYKICDGLATLEKMGWKVPPARPVGGKDPRARAATKEDCLQFNRGIGATLSIKPGDMIAPAGLYAGDKDMFAFLVNEGKPIGDGTKGGYVNRGIFVKNSEVGDGSFKITTFLYDAVCGNHIVWDASEITTIRVRHLGNAEPKAFAALEKDLSAYLDADVAKVTKKIVAARKTELGKDRTETVETLFKNRKIGLTEKELYSAYDLAEKLDGNRVNPRTLWGMVTGVTRLSQEEQNANHRTVIDQAAGELMAMLN